MSEKTIKILQLLGGGNAIGGVEKMLLNDYSYMDKNKVRFDFCFYRKSTLIADQNVKNGLLNGSKIFDLCLFDKRNVLWGYFKSIKIVSQIIKTNNYDVVHINAGRPPLLLCGLISAKIAKIPKIIIHSHSTKGMSDRNFIEESLYQFLFAISSSLFRRYGTILAGCSVEAGKYMFGNNIEKSSKYIPIRNAIAVEPFLFNTDVRNKVREEQGVTGDTFVIGHVGSFSQPKNHLFLIEIFYEIKKCNANCMLWMVGTGSLKASAERKVKELGIEKDVKFLGERGDTNRLYQGMDIMVFPSLWEGLSVSIVEAQAASLPVYASSNLSPEHQLTGCVRFIPLYKGAKYWANMILEEKNNLPPRRNTIKQITESGYNIEVEAQSLQNLYLRLARKV